MPPWLDGGLTRGVLSKTLEALTAAGTPGHALRMSHHPLEPSGLVLGAHWLDPGVG